MTPLDTLLDALANEPLDNWGEEFLSELRSRLPEEPRLQQALVDRLRLDGALYATMSDKRLNVEELVRLHRRRRQVRSRWWLFSGGVAVLLIAASAALFVRPDRPRLVERAEPLLENAAGRGDSTGEPSEPEPLPDALREADDVPPPLSEVADARRPANLPVEVAAATPMTEVMSTEPADGVAPAIADAAKTIWSRRLAEDTPPQTPDAAAEQVARETAETGINSNVAGQWWGEVPGRPLAWHDERRADRNFVRFDGWARLLAPWRTDAVLRLEAFDIEYLTLVVTAGTDTFRFRVDPRRRPLLIVCDAITGDGSNTAEISSRLLGTDNGRFHHGEPGLLELRWHAGRLLLMQRETCLMAIPADAPPDDVVLHGRFRLASSVVYRGTPTVDLPPDDAELAGALPAASYAWDTGNEEATGAIFYDDDRVRWQRTGADDAVIWLDRPQDGFWQVDLEIADAAIGTGICLGNDEGEITYAVAARREQQTGWTVFQPVRYGDRGLEVRLSENDLLQRVGVNDRRLRVTCGAGIVRLSTCSGSGTWGAVDTDLVYVDGQLPTRLGLFVWRQASPGAAIELRSAKFRDVTPFDQAPPLSVEVAEAVENAAGYDSWLAAILSDGEMNAERADLRHAMTASLPVVRNRNLRRELLVRRLEADLNLPWDEFRQLASQVAAITDLRNNRETAPFFAVVERAAITALENDPENVFRQLTETLQAAPLETEPHPIALRLDVAEQELLRNLSLRRWEPLANTIQACRRFADPVAPDRRWLRPGEKLEQLVDELATITPGAISTGRGHGRSSRAELRRDPLLLISNKEIFNLSADLGPSIAEARWDEAARRITSAGFGAVEGLATSAEDADLWQSLPTMIDAALAASPDLENRLIAEHDAVSLIVAGKAMAAGNAAAVWHAATVHPRTRGAARANLWLGDRAMAEGDYRAAWRFYQSADVADARARLAASLSNLTDPGGPANHDAMIIDGIELPEDMVPHRERPAATATAEATPADQAAPEQTASEPVTSVSVQFELHNFETVPDQFRDIPPSERASAGLASVSVDDTIYVAGLNSLTAIDAGAEAPKWSLELPKPNVRHPGAQVAREPCVSGEFVYATLLTADTSVLIAVDRRSGTQASWIYEGMPRPASQPFELDGLICFFGTQAVGQSAVEATLTRLDPGNGRVVRSDNLGQIRNPEPGYPMPARTVVGRFGFLVSYPGVLFCCDPTGRPAWVRQYTAIPPDLLATGPRRAAIAIDESADRIVVVSPGHSAVDGIELSTGRLLWQRWVPGLTAASISTDQATDHQVLVVQGDFGLKRLWLGDGEWELRRLADTDGVASSATHAGTTFTAMSHSTGKPARYEIATYDTANDRPTGQRLTELADPKQRVLGVLPDGHDRIRLLIGTGDSGSRWAFSTPLSVDPTVTATPLGQINDGFVWRGISDSEPNRRLSIVLGGWTLVNAGNVGVEIQLIDGRQTAVLKPKPNLPLVLARSSGGSGRSLEFGVRPEEAWQVSVRGADPESAVLELNGEGQPAIGWTPLPIEAFVEPDGALQVLVLTGGQPAATSFLIASGNESSP